MFRSIDEKINHIKSLNKETPSYALIQSAGMSAVWIGILLGVTTTLTCYEALKFPDSNWITIGLGIVILAFMLKFANQLTYLLQYYYYQKHIKQEGKNDAAS